MRNKGPVIMAKFGEGDPRWIVEERPDATNVNNWHWTEKNASPWSRDKLTKLLQGLLVEDENVGQCEIKSITTLEGEASANNRKAKLIFFYEWNIQAEWEGVLKDHHIRHKGKLDIPNLSDEHSDPSDIDITITVDKSNKDSSKLKDLMHRKGSELIREQLGIYIKDLKSEFSQGMILPSKGGQPNTKPPNNTKTVDKKEFDAIRQPTPTSTSTSTSQPGVKLSVKTLKDTITFQCQPHHIYNALTVPDMVRAFTQGSVQKFENEKGGRFVLLDHAIAGEFTQLSPYERLEMRWRLKSWPEAHYSKVTIDISSKESDTQVKLTQTGIPADDFDRTREGWHRNYWHSIRQTFGFGAKPIF